MPPWWREVCLWDLRCAECFVALLRLFSTFFIEQLLLLNRAVATVPSLVKIVWLLLFDENYPASPSHCFSQLFVSLTHGFAKSVAKWNPGNFCFRNPKSWALKSAIQLKESGIPLQIEIRNPRFTDKESEIQYLESEIHCVESRIQTSLTDLYMGQPFTNELQTHFRSLDRSCIYWALRRHHRIGQREARKAREVNFFRISAKRSVLLRSIASWLCKEM